MTTLPRYHYQTKIPAEITTPDQVSTRIGQLDYFDGIPTAETAAKLFDHLDFLRGVEAFLSGVPGASLVAIRRALRASGATGNCMAIFETLMDSRSIFLTANTETIYCWNWMDLKDGPVVVETPPNVLGVVDDFWFRYVTDIGNAGPDRGKGGKYLFLPPGYQGEVPEGYFVFRPATFGNLLFLRGFMQHGDSGPGVASVKAGVRIYQLTDAANPPRTSFVNLSGKDMNTVHANDIHFFKELNEIIQEEPVEAYGPEAMGIFAAIGLRKGTPFAPDARMTAILTDAVAVGNATARAIDFRNRDPESLIYPDRQWHTPFIGGSYEWLTDGWRNYDARTMFFYAATIDTPAMAMKMVGIGSQYASANIDADGEPFDGAKTYRLHVPADVPAKDFWSVVLYDPQTRSMLQTDQQFPSFSSQINPVINADGSVDVWFAPERPEGGANWVQSVPGKSWFTIFRLYGPLEPWFDQSWKLPDIERIG
ncbi:DUF1254 domain-containing protein [Novosphingobium sp. BL-8H]|uniref:DUF1254 domain-containing protein n=1 Tax=Novosphingobium sp. BL-8H TaxID=3127640 RepID=UPI0037564EC2